jgi:ribosomal protein L11 methyltransferase
MYLWKYHASLAWLEAHESALQTAHPGRVAIIAQPGRARSVVQVTCRTRGAASSLLRQFGGAAERLARNWQQKYLAAEAHTPLRIGRRLFILTSPAQCARPHLVIPAAGAFGTGKHATTAMCLRLLEETTRKMTPGWRILDAGTGTGILALAARRFGAVAAIGVDNDPRALAHAKTNATLNRMPEVEFVRRDFVHWKSRRRYDIISANLFSELLIAAAPVFRCALRDHGALIVSGMLREQAPAVIRAFRRSGFRLEKECRRGKWVALRCRREAAF